jgi:hypothetical protein
MLWKQAIKSALVAALAVPVLSTPTTSHIAKRASPKYVFAHFMVPIHLNANN